MPGLVGFANLDDSQVNRTRVLQKMLELIIHNDSSVRDEFFSDASVCATRSHIEANSNNTHPYHRDGIYIWLDGEFYNQREISVDPQSALDDDAAILLALFKQSRDFSFLRQIDGIFSAAIYDSIEQKVYLITDRYGLRHLYWTVHKGGLVWGSEVKAMLALPGFEPKIDLRAVEEFFGVGHLLEDRTWFEGVELLSSGTVLTWDIREQSLRKQRYWRWDEITPIVGRIDPEEIAQELGRLFIDAVGRRCREGERIGLMLSGGLDSRAILAATPDKGYPIHGVTFGKRGCDDIRIASLAAEVKGAVHRIVEISENNWLMPRLDGVWWTDGQLDLMHMHGIEALPEIKRWCDVCLNGFLGDATIGGSYLNDPKVGEIEKIENRGRRFIALSVFRPHVKERIPFFDNQFMNLTIAIPGKLRAGSYIYDKMLLKMFPQFFKTIPWQKTGIPISWPSSITKGALLLRRVKDKLLRESSRLGFQYNSRNDYTNYASWIRQEPAKSFFKMVLTNSLAIYPNYVSERQVNEDLEKHLNGDNRAEVLCRYLTFEVWLQQIFEGRFRYRKSHP
jgi:asparagine synthase (glutamine-hydrolysing)